MKDLFNNVFPTLALGIVLLAPAFDSSAGMVIESLDGPVSKAEIDSFKNFMATRTPPRSQTYDNAIADGTAGMESEALGLMYEVTNDPALLDRLMLYADQFLVLRNDTNHGRILWTGRREPVWLTKPADSPQAGYAGCENNDIAGHIACCARLILQSPGLWDKTAPTLDAQESGETYFQRAKAYIREMDIIQDGYMLKWFVNLADNRICAPTNASWAALHESATAWNRQMMFINAFQRLSECHQMLGDDPARVARYDAIVQAAVNWFVSGLRPYVKNDRAVYNWSYAPGITGSENLSLHADYDIWGVTRACLSGRYTNLSESVMAPFGNTLQYVIHKGNNTFANFVSGDDSKTRNHVYPAWMLLAQFTPEVYDITARANIGEGAQARTAIFDAFILWTKNARYRGVFASNPRSPDFTIIAPWLLVPNAESNIVCKVSLNPLNGFTGTVVLGASGLPEGVTATFSPPSVNRSSDISTLTLLTSGSAPGGIYSFGCVAITGVAGPITRISPLTLALSSPRAPAELAFPR
jgi:hypothetical protein